MIMHGMPNTRSTSSAVMISAGFPFRHDLAVTHGDDVIGIAAGVVEIVQHRDQGLTALAVELAEQIQQLDLCAMSRYVVGSSSSSSGVCCANAIATQTR